MVIKPPQFFKQQQLVDPIQSQLENFQKWLAAKSVAHSAKPHFYRDNEDRQALQPTRFDYKPLSCSFFNQKQNQLAVNIDIEKDLKKRNIPEPMMFCNNCGEANHNELSCVKPQRGSKRK